jgi:putative flippase GtrA
MLSEARRSDVVSDRRHGGVRRPDDQRSRVKKLLADQRVRFIIAGALNTALDFVLLNCLILFAGLPILAANILSVTVGITISYFLNHFFVFKFDRPVSAKRFLEFFAVTGFSSLLLQSGVIWLFEVMFDTTFGRSLLLVETSAQEFVAINVAKAAAVLIGLIWNFTMYKFVVFKKPVEDDTDASALSTPTTVDATRSAG